MAETTTLDAPGGAGGAAPPESSPPRDGPTAGASRFASADLVEKYGLLVAWLVVYLAFAIALPAFRQTETLMIILGSQSTQILVTLAVIVSLIGGEFDLSVANVLGGSAVMVAYLNSELGWPILVTIPFILVFALLFGLFNSFLVLRVGILSIVATLGSGTLLSGIVSGIAGDSPRGGVSTAFVDVFRHKILGLPVAFYLVLAIGIVLYYVLEHTPFGRHLRLVGRSRDVARLAGVRVDRLRLVSLVGCSLLASFAGIVLVGNTGAMDASVAGGYLLPAFAGAFLGSTTIRPGEFNVWGSFLAVFFLVTGVTGLQIAGYTGWVSNVFYGASLIVAVAITQLVARQRGQRDLLPSQPHLTAGAARSARPSTTDD